MWTDPLGLMPDPNNGVGGGNNVHGVVVHNKCIDDTIADLKKDPSIENIRKNQQQVDVNGNIVGTNKPDIQYDKNGVHYNHEFDTKAVASANHKTVVTRNDPKAVNQFDVIDENGNVVSSTKTGTHNEKKSGCEKS